jgi:hypothetical protein
VEENLNYSAMQTKTTKSLIMTTYTFIAITTISGVVQTPDGVASPFFNTPSDAFRNAVSAIGGADRSDVDKLAAQINKHFEKENVGQIFGSNWSVAVHRMPHRVV